MGENRIVGSRIKGNLSGRCCFCAVDYSLKASCKTNRRQGARIIFLACLVLTLLLNAENLFNFQVQWIPHKHSVIWILLMHYSPYFKFHTKYFILAKTHWLSTSVHYCYGWKWPFLLNLCSLCLIGPKIIIVYAKTSPTFFPREGYREKRKKSKTKDQEFPVIRV